MRDFLEFVGFITLLMFVVGVGATAAACFHFADGQVWSLLWLGSYFAALGISYVLIRALVQSFREENKEEN